MSIENLEVEAMKLPPEERERLAEKLLSSVMEARRFLHGNGRPLTAGQPG